MPIEATESESLYPFQVAMIGMLRGERWRRKAWDPDVAASAGPDPSDPWFVISPNEPTAEQPNPDDEEPVNAVTLRDMRAADWILCDCPGDLTDPPRGPYLRWVVEFEVHPLWVQDGFDLDDDDAERMIQTRLSHAHGYEVRAKVLSAPPARRIRRLQTGMVNP